MKIHANARNTVNARADLVEQVECDTGSGANLGSLEARTNGIGPSISHVQSFCDRKGLADFHWIREYETRRRPEGDLLMLKAMVRF
jgi:hypothetical protein